MLTALFLDPKPSPAAWDVHQNTLFLSTRTAWRPPKKLKQQHDLPPNPCLLPISWISWWGELQDTMPGSGQILKVCKPLLCGFISFWDWKLHAILMNASLIVYGTWTIFRFIWNIYDKRFGTLIPCRCLERHPTSTQKGNNLVTTLHAGKTSI